MSTFHFCLARWYTVVILTILGVAAVSPSALAASGCVVPTKLGVTFIIDDSGSMSTSDPDELRGEAVRVGLDQLPDGSLAAAASFDTSSRELFAASEVNASTRNTLAAEAASRLYPSGNTNYREAFTVAGEQLEDLSAADRRAVIFLSDGKPTSRSVASEDAIINQGIPIYTIGFGDADLGILEDIAADSGAQTFWAGSTGELQSVFARIVATLTCDAQTVTEELYLAPGETQQVPFAVGADDGEFRALAAWSYGDIAVTATRPNGTTLGETSLLTGEAFTGREAYALLTGLDPAAGGWVLNLTAAPGNDTDVSVSIDVWKRTLVKAQVPLPPQPPTPTPTPTIVAAPQPAAEPPAPDGSVTGKLSNGKNVTVNGTNIFQAFKEGYDNAHPCDGRPEVLENKWVGVGDSFLCVFSGKVFWDNDKEGKAKALCIVNIGLNVLPIAKLRVVPKVGGKIKKIAEAHRDGAKALKAYKLKKSDRVLLDNISNAGDWSKIIATGDVLGGINWLLASRKNAARIEKLLKTNGNLKAARRLHAVQDISSDLLTVLTGIDDVLACKKAFDL